MGIASAIFGRTTKALADEYSHQISKFSAGAAVHVKTGVAAGLDVEKRALPDAAKQKIRAGYLDLIHKNPKVASLVPARLERIVAKNSYNDALQDALQEIRAVHLFESPAMGGAVPRSSLKGA